MLCAFVAPNFYMPTVNVSPHFSWTLTVKTENFTEPKHLRDFRLQEYCCKIEVFWPSTRSSFGNLLSLQML